MSYLGIIITFVFINNFVLTQFLGLCPFIGVSRRLASALGMGFAMIFVMSLSSLLTWLIYNGLLVPYNLDFLQTITFVLAIALLVRVVELIINKISPVLHKVLGIYLPLLTMNCAVLGIALIIVRKNYSPLESFTAGFAAGLGVLLAMLIMSAIRERLETERVPKPFRGIPIALISAGLMAMAFMAFDMGFLKNIVG